MSYNNVIILTWISASYVILDTINKILHVNHVLHNAYYANQLILVWHVFLLIFWKKMFVNPVLKQYLSVVNVHKLIVFHAWQDITYQWIYVNLANKIAFSVMNLFVFCARINFKYYLTVHVQLVLAIVKYVEEIIAMIAK